MPAEPNVGLVGRALAEGSPVTAGYGDTGLRVPALGGEVAVSPRAAPAAVERPPRSSAC